MFLTHLCPRFLVGSFLVQIFPPEWIRSKRVVLVLRKVLVQPPSSAVNTIHSQFLAARCRGMIWRMVPIKLKVLYIEATEPLKKKANESLLML